MIQLDHNDIRNIDQSVSIFLIAENIRTPENVGMIMRLSEAFGVKKIYFVGEHSIDLTNKVKRASRNTFKTVTYEFMPNVKEKIEMLINSGYHSVALEITKRSKPIQNFKSGQDKKIILAVGSERTGISEELLLLCKSHYHIQMFGENSSINVVNALSIALYKITENQTQK